jgi:hypothetical protein
MGHKTKSKGLADLSQDPFNNSQQTQGVIADGPHRSSIPSHRWKNKDPEKIAKPGITEASFPWSCLTPAPWWWG